MPPVATDTKQPMHIVANSDQYAPIKWTSGWVSSVDRVAGSLGNVTAMEYYTSVMESPDGWQLHMPMLVLVRRDETGVTLNNELTGIYGAGDNLTTASADFFSALLEYRDVLAREPHLSPELQHLLIFLAGQLG